MATWQNDAATIWQQYEELRLDREYRYFETLTRRECPRHGVWRTYEADSCPDCGSERLRGEVA